MKRLALVIFIPFIFVSLLSTNTAGMGPNASQLPPPVEQPGQVPPPPAEERPAQAVVPEGGPPGPAVTGPVGQAPKAPVKQPEATQAAPAEPQRGQPAPPRPPQITATGGTVSFFFDDADIFEVAQTVFGDVLRVNYIIDPRVKGRVTFRTVTPIPRDEVLPVMEIILRLNGIGFVEEKGLYRIVPLTEVSKELVYSQVGKPPEKVAIELFTFKNVNIKDSMKEIEDAIGLHLNGGTLRILPIYRLNALLVVASTKEHMDYVRRWVEVFDRMFEGARPKVFVYPLQNSKASHIASLLQAIFSGTAPAAATPTTATTTAQPKPPAAPQTATATAPPAQAPKAGPAVTAAGTGFLVSPDTRVFADEITNSLIVIATPSDYSFIEETVKKIDTIPRQVMIEALIAEVTLSDTMTFGLEWSLKTDVNIKGLKPFTRDINLSGDVASKSGLDTTKGGFTFLATDPTGIVRATLQALAAEDKVKVLASPHILASDNREARIQIGDQVPIATSQTLTTTTPPQTTTTIQYKDTGTILKVKPQVNESGLVSLEITQEVSDFSTKQLFGTDQIIISKREATTNLVAQDGQTIVIGGLIKDKTTRGRTGIPLLSSIPILGYLFGKTTDENTRTELIILLTPHVIRNQAEAKDVTSGYINRLKGVDEAIKKEGLIKGEQQKEKGEGDEDPEGPAK